MHVVSDEKHWQQRTGNKELAAKNWQQRVALDGVGRSAFLRNFQKTGEVGVAGLHVRGATVPLADGLASAIKVTD